MATSNIKKKIAALAELRKDPAAAIESAWKNIKSDVITTTTEDGADVEIQDHDVDLVEQILSAVVADIRADAAKTTPTN